MELFLEFGLVGLIVIGATAFLGTVSTKIAQALGGKKKKDAFEQTLITKNGWKPVERKRT